MVARTWNGGAAGNWAVAGNWLPAVIPGPGDTATIDRAGGADVTGDANIACDAIYIGQVNGANILDVEHDFDVPEVIVYNQAGNILNFDGAAVGPIDVEVDELNIQKTSGVLISGTVDLHGPSYSAPCTLHADTVDHWLNLAATANLELWWIIDDKTTYFSPPNGAKIRAVRGVQFLALTDHNPEVHVVGTRYKLPGSFKIVKPFSGGRYGAQDNTKARSHTAHHGPRAAGIGWAGTIDDATYKFIKDELQYWSDEGQVLQVFIRDRAIYGYITNMQWRPAGTGASKDTFEYEIEFTEVNE